MNVWSTLDAASMPSRTMPWPELETPFTMVEPAGSLPVLFAAPHSGRRYPKSFQRSSVLDTQALRASEDAWVDQLFADASQCGAAVLNAHFPRAMLDPNRAADELDPTMYADHCPTPQRPKSARVAAGLGVIPRIVAAGVDIYPGRISYAEAIERLHHLYTPYHKALLATLTAHKKRFGSALLVDCHSMPSNCAAHCPGGSADFVLGDGHGRTCTPQLSAHVEHTLIQMGYRVVRNTPYSGGYSTLRYGKPAHGFEALQIEINRALYMDEENHKKAKGFARLRKDMRLLGQSVCDYVAAKNPL